MGNPNVQKLIEINEEIKSLKAVKCRITHEKVQINGETNLPISTFIGEKVYERIGFCDEQIRKERISCSHTIAPDILHNALNLLDETGENIADLRTKLMDTIFQIHQLDHRKSDAEKHLVIQIEKNLNESDISLATQEIKNIENEHDKRVNEIAEVRDQIVVEIEKVIKDD